MPLLTDVRDAACLYLKTALPDALRVEAFAGSLDFDSLSPRGVQYSEQACLFIAPGECRNVGRELALDCEADFWAFSVARHAARPTIASNASLALAQKAAIAIHGQTFGLTGVSPANVRYVNAIASEDFEKVGIWAWELSFTMRVVFGELAQ